MFDENKTAPDVDKTLDNADTGTPLGDNLESEEGDPLLDEYNGGSDIDPDFELDEDDDESDDEGDDDDDNKDWKKEAKTLKKRYGNSTKEAQRLVRKTKVLEKHAKDVAPIIKAIKDNPSLAKEIGKVLNTKPTTETTEGISDERIDKIEAELNAQKREGFKSFENSHSDVKFTAPIRAKIGRYAKIYLDEGMSQAEALEEALKDTKRRLGIKESKDSIQDDQRGVSVGSNNAGQTAGVTQEKGSVSDRELQETFNKAGKPHLGPLGKKSNKK